MAFYPTWQDPSQGWQNQFIQQIPQNTPGISALNPIDFQPQVSHIDQIKELLFLLYIYIFVKNKRNFEYFD